MKPKRKRNRSPTAKTGALVKPPLRTTSASSFASRPEPDPLNEDAWAEIARAMKLSPRKLQVCRGIYQDLKQSTIASNLGISRDTVHCYCRQIFDQLAVRSRGRLMLHIMEEFFALILSGKLPPICPHHAKGSCPLHLIRPAKS
jgi:DNA-binding NarL/FixJ family response regulator